jgi:hypothetical protein
MTEWLGHCEDVEQKHYLKVTETVGELRRQVNGPE